MATFRLLLSRSHSTHSYATAATRKCPVKSDFFRVDNLERFICIREAGDTPSRTLKQNQLSWCSYGETAIGTANSCLFFKYFHSYYCPYSIRNNLVMQLQRASNGPDTLFLRDYCNGGVNRSCFSVPLAYNWRVGTVIIWAACHSFEIIIYTWVRNLYWSETSPLVHAYQSQQRSDGWQLGCGRWCGGRVHQGYGAFR